MLRFFRNNPDGESTSLPFTYIFLAVVVLLNVGSFFLQLGLGVCPVP